MKSRVLHSAFHPTRFGSRRGFTIIEILVAATITVILVGILLKVTTVTGNAVKQSSAALTAFSTARTAFDAMTQKLAQATLNPYLDYYGNFGSGAPSYRRTTLTSNSFHPIAYGRASDLQFCVRQNVEAAGYGQEVYFQAPEAYSVAAATQSVQGLLSACGYYVAFGNSNKFQPTAVAANRYRYRLMQGMEPTENLQIFSAEAQSNLGQVSDPSPAASLPKWNGNITNVASTGPITKSVDVAPLADNVIALIVWPRLAIQEDAAGTMLTTDFTYDSQYSVVPTVNAAGLYTQKLTADQLPPCLQVTMIVIDEASAIRLGNGNLPPATIENALLGRFALVTNYASDLSSVASTLSAAHINFQIFDQTVALRESKWTK